MSILRPIELAAALLVAAGAVSAQARVLVVDSKQGPYKTINSAVAVARSGDRILVHKGTYNETIVLDKKPLSILGATGNPADVVISAKATGPSDPPLLAIRNHPAGVVSRFANFTLHYTLFPVFNWLYGSAVETASTAGTIVFDGIVANSTWFLNNHNGALSIRRCATVVSATNFNKSALSVTGVRYFFLQGSTFLNPRAYWGNGLYGSIVSGSIVEISQCSFLGVQGQKGFAGAPSDGTAALYLTGSQARISGTSSDTFVGGPPASYPNAVRGGPGLHADASVVRWSGVTFKSGGTVPAVVTTSGGTVAQISPAISLLTPASRFAPGSRTRVDVHAPPYGVSLTWLSPNVVPSVNPLGAFTIDFTKPKLDIWSIHDAQGRASFMLDLRSLPRSFVGSHFVMQTAAVDRTLALSLSSPLVAIVGH